MYPTLLIRVNRVNNSNTIRYHNKIECKHCRYDVENLS